MEIDLKNFATLVTVLEYYFSHVLRFSFPDLRFRQKMVDGEGLDRRLVFKTWRVQGSTF